MIEGATKSIVARMLTVPFVAHAARTIGKRSAGARACIVLNFHSIVRDDHTGLRKGRCVHTKAGEFDDVLRLLCRRLRPIGLDELVSRLRSGADFEEDCFAVTLDDGYADNLELAAPILQAHGVPATVFLATDYIGTGRILLLDKVTFVVQTAAEQSIDFPGAPDGVLRLADTPSRMQANRLVAEHVKALPVAEQERAVARLAERLQVDLDRMRPPMLDWEQVKRLAGFGIGVGSHGRTHRIMTSLSLEAAVAEMRDSREAIRENAGLVPRHFAYPNGLARDFSAALRREARKIGYEGVLSCVQALNLPGVSDPLDIGRIGLADEGLGRTMLVIERMLGQREQWARIM